MAARKKASAKTTRKKSAARKNGGGTRDQTVVAHNKKLDRLTVDLILKTAKGVHADILKQTKPDLTFPVRSLKNVTYSTQRGYFEIGKQKKTRTRY